MKAEAREVSKAGVRMSAAAGSTALRMVLLPALMWSTLVVSESKWSECVCSGGFCYCDWVFGLDFRGDICNVKKTRINVCFKAWSAKNSRDLRHERGCSCSRQQCVCQFGTDVEGSDICFRSSDDVECVPAKTSSGEVYRRKRSMWSDCICNGAICHCVWTTPMGIYIRGPICLVQQKRNVVCRRMQLTNNLQNVENGRDCFCSLYRCVCNFGTVAKYGEICFHLKDLGRLCFPIKTSSK